MKRVFRHGIEPATQSRLLSLRRTLRRFRATDLCFQRSLDSYSDRGVNTISRWGRLTDSLDWKMPSRRDVIPPSRDSMSLVKRESTWWPLQWPQPARRVRCPRPSIGDCVASPALSRRAPTVQVPTRCSWVLRIAQWLCSQLVHRCPGGTLTPVLPQRRDRPGADRTLSTTGAACAQPFSPSPSGTIGHPRHRATIRGGPVSVHRC